MKILTHKYRLNDEFFSNESISGYEPAVTIHAEFFRVSKKKKRNVLRMIVWWSIKEYAKTFKK